MTLRKKSLLSIGFSIVALVAVMYALAENVLLQSFEALEKQRTIKDVHRVQAGLETSLDYLSEKAYDWSHWDDLYHFVEVAGKAPDSPRARAFLDSNIDASVFSSLKINFILIFDRAGKLILGRGWDLESAKEIDLPPELLSRHLLPGTPLLAHQSPTATVRGLLLLARKPLLIVSQPVVDSSGTAPIRGALIFGRFLDIAEVKRLSRLTLLPVTLKRLDDPELPADFSAALAAITPQGPIFTRLEGEDRIVGYTRLQDLYGRPALMARVDLPRDIYRRGQFAAHSILYVILAGGLLFTLLTLVLLDRTAFARLTRLSREVLGVGSSGDLQARVDIGGKDELSDLGVSINKMLSLLEAAQKRIRESEAGMRLILNTVPDGLLSIDERCRINPGFSRSAAALLGREELAGRDYLEAIGLAAGDEARAELQEFLEVVRQRLLPEDSLISLNPTREIEVHHPDGSVVWLRTLYTRIDRGPDQPPHLLVALSDITRERQMAEKAARSARENRQLRAIAEDPDLFREFMIEMRVLLEQVGASVGRVHPDRPFERETLDALYRGVHTIKGTAGAFGLLEVATVAGSLEDTLSAVRARAAVSPVDLEDIRELLSLLQEAFQEAVRHASQVLGDGLDDRNDLVLRVPLSDVKRLEESLSFLEVGLDLKIDLLDELRRLREVPIERALARTARMVPDLIRRLGREVRFIFDHHDVSVDLEFAQHLNAPLLHLIRNAIDHGIEMPEERIARGKPIEGTLRLSAWRDGDLLTLELCDDGAGMDPERLRATAVAKGLLSEAAARALSDDASYALIFRPGFSTARTVTDISGRGVGMDAVLTTIRDDLGGEVRIDTRAGAGTTFTLEVPLRQKRPARSDGAEALARLLQEEESLGLESA